jgi:voltage-gated potassium channel
MEKGHGLKDRLHEIIFEADTKEGKWFDIGLLIMILLSIVVVLLDSIFTIHQDYGNLLYIIEWAFTIIFTAEYILRIYSVRNSWKYILSFYGLIDLISILPTYMSMFILGSQNLIVIRALRLLRIFRILRLANYTFQGRELTKALARSRTKITIFMIFILVMVTIIGSVMYLVEAGSNPGFDSIPRSIYWTIVTLTTVGYGDITPVTNLGQFLSAFIMLLGYSIIAVPTGIVSGELMRASMKSGSDSHANTITCRFCASEGHDSDADYCKYCGEKL